MNYGLVYTIPFATLDNVPCVVEIEKDGYTGEVTELIAGDTPFTVDIDSEEFLYTPTRFSIAKLQVVGNDYLQALFSTEYRQYRVTMKKDGVVSWCGFIKPELYTQDYTAETFILEIECTSAMSVLEFIDYTKEGADKAFVSIWSLLKRCIAISYGKYNAVYLPYVYARTKADYEAGTNVIDSMTISEQNFFDEDDKPMKLSEVLEEICKFLNWTCVDWKGELYFIDIDYSGVYHKYNTALTDKVDVEKNSLTVQNIGFTGANHSLDILSGFNKVTVKCSNYVVGQMLPEEDFDNLKELSAVDNTSSDNTKVCRAIYLHPDMWECFLFKDGSVIGNDGLSSIREIAPSLYGAMLTKLCVYEQEKDINGDWNPKISDYSFTDSLRVRFPSVGTPGIINPIGFVIGYKVLTFKGASATYMDCALGVNASTKFIKDDDMIPWLNSAAGRGRTVLTCQIRIGDEYYGNHSGDQFYNFAWGKDSSNFVRLGCKEWNNDGAIEWLSIPNGKTLKLPYNGLSGFIVPVDRPISGEFEFTIFVPDNKMNGSSNPYTAGVVIKDLSVKIQNKDGVSGNDNNSDRTYENVLNENYINELDEIEFKISSYNNDGACYSKVMLGDGYLRDNLYNAILDKTKRPEELLITRIINHYSATRIKLTQVIKSSDEISPLTILSDTFLVNKKFINAGGSIDYKMNRFECIMIEV